MKASISQVIAGIRYNTEADSTTLIAHNEYWDGSNFERGGRNTHLYRTAKGRYFAAYATQWQGESSYIEPLDLADAMTMYERLREKEVEYEEAFPGEIAEDA